MALSEQSAVRSYLKTERRLQKGRYALRQTVYVFPCVRGCGREIEVRRSDLPKVSGRCRNCADIDTGVISSYRERKRPYEALYNRFQYDRQRSGQLNSITYEEFVAFTKTDSCFYCGSPVTWAQKTLQKNGYRYNLDRKENSKGYSVTNCVVCCWECNELKGDRLNFEEMVAAMQAVMQVRNRVENVTGRRN